MSSYVIFAAKLKLLNIYFSHRHFTQQCCSTPQILLYSVLDKTSIRQIFLLSLLPSVPSLSITSCFFVAYMPPKENFFSHPLGQNYIKDVHLGCSKVYRSPWYAQRLQFCLEIVCCCVHFLCEKYVPRMFYFSHRNCIQRYAICNILGICPIESVHSDML